jgi:hypothetical protein
MTKIIAFAGRKQSGKTTCSEYVKTKFNNQLYKRLFETINNVNIAKIYNFADPLKKDICMNILGLTYEQCYGEDIDKNTLTDIVWEGQRLTAREVMQFVGTDLFRKMKHDVWAGATINKINLEQPPLAIIADCRFPNEVDVVKKAGGLVIKLKRNPFDSTHASETALDPINYNENNFDLVIDNCNISIDEQNQIIYNFLKDKKVLS